MKQEKKSWIINGKENTNLTFGVMKWRDIVAIFQIQNIFYNAKV